MEQINLKLELPVIPNCRPVTQNNLQSPNNQVNLCTLSEIWRSLVYDYFPSRLDLLEYKIAWSPRRQKRTLASCNLRAKRILVAQELNNNDYHWVLSPLAYHELCHAVLGYSVRSETGKSSWHGKKFRALERQHPEIELLNRWIKEGGWRQAVRRHRGRLSSKKLTSKKRIPKKKLIRNSLLSRFLKNLLLK